MYLKEYIYKNCINHVPLVSAFSTQYFQHRKNEKREKIKIELEQHESSICVQLGTVDNYSNFTSRKMKFTKGFSYI